MNNQQLPSFQMDQNVDQLKNIKIDNFSANELPNISISQNRE